MFQVDEIMTENPICLTATDSLADAAMLMNENRIRHIPIVDDDHHLKGLITQRDVVSSKDNWLTKKIGDVMKKKLVTTEPTAPLRSSAILMQKHKIGCLPVVAGEKLVGIITDSDYVALSINLLEQLEDMEPEPVDNFEDDEEDLP